ncbi:hypothetical protein [Stutzerimonas stutzeri]|uniref:hypothetical protein n=1 Tax=Stutzerimonas stutzeri TaxID=316 RepID=UPI00265D510F|nr:hypothetical protein [Stutzerimonas stutzeri]MCF6783444.1 hypothetical protein [Stutzerimonas stutzeri]
MGIALKSSLSPQLMKIVVGVACILVLLVTWQTIQQKVHDLRYQVVYGEQSHVDVLQERPDLHSLPIVMAKSDEPTLVNESINDAEIEAAFREPVFEPIVEEEPLKVPLTTQLVLLYSPKINGVSSNGAIVNNRFWSIGEPMVSMTLKDDKGRVVTPRIVRVGALEVVLSVDGESLSLPFNGK